MQDQKDSPAIAQQIAILSESAAELVRRGQRDDAAKIYEQIFEVAPYHLDALDFLAMRAYGRRDTDLSLQLLERSSRVDPDRASTYMNMGIVYKIRGEYTLALQSLDKALELQPNFPHVLLHKGTVLEQLGRQQEAIRAYLQAFKLAPLLRQPDQATHIPRHLLRMAAHADELIVQSTLKLLEAALAPVRAAHGAQELKRVDEFADLYIGRRQPRYKHASQRPAFLYFPELEPQAFFARSEFDWCIGLEAATADIKTELQAILQEPDALRPYVEVAAPDAAEWTPLNHSLQWGAFHLYKDGMKVEENCRRCPATLKAIEKLPLTRIPRYSPEVFFSILKPGTHIPPHYGLTNYKAAVHLPLIVPPDCSIRVGNETRSWTEGECLIFDDSFRHEAWNNSSEIRAVLILDIWNPQLSSPERAAISEVLGVIQELGQ